MRSLLVLLFVTVLVISLSQPYAFAHQSGCHRWHSCPSDRGTYECGDTGYCSQCTDNNYCKAGRPISGSSSSGSSSSGSLSLPTPNSNQALSTCDASLWSHVYHKDRLKVIDPCKTVTGIIKYIKKEKDGDYHIRLKLDSQYANLVNSANEKYQHGYLVLEPICQNKVTQKDAVSACTGFVGHVAIPKIGSHVVVTGSYVLDLDHDSWAEIHPVTSMVKIQ
jgi:hypothetical protein